MKQHIEERVIASADFMIKTKCTLRELAKHFNVTKSTSHIDVTERLKKLDKRKYDEIQKILSYNSKVKHIRGGMTTQMKYKGKEMVNYVN